MGALERWRSGGYLRGIWEEVAGCGEGDCGGISVGLLLALEVDSGKDSRYFWVLEEGSESWRLGVFRVCKRSPVVKEENQF